MTAITAITAQNTVGVNAIETLSPAIIRRQVESVTDDIGVAAVKVGMLGDVATIEAVAAALDYIADRSGAPVVVDPVMISETGARLLAREALRKLVVEILPRSTVATPNIPEARALTGLDEAASQGELAVAMRALGPDCVVVTGGHSEQMIDIFYAGGGTVAIPGPAHLGDNAHGSGCTHSSVIAARLALGDDPLAAARVARRLAGEAVAAGLADIGAGPGPVNILGIGRGKVSTR